MKNPQISVILPVYNGEKYLNEAIESILNQTFHDFELIIINDGSTDKSEAIILSYHDERIIYIKQVNTGVGASLYLGCKAARGKYIARMDADDISLSNRLAIQYNYLEKNNNVVLVSNAVKYIDNNGRELGRSFPYTSHWAIKKKMKFSSPICHPSVMMKKKSYDCTVGYKNVQPFEDLFLWHEISKYGKLHNLCSPLLKYRVLDSSVSHSMPSKEKTKLLQFLLNNSNNVVANEIFISEYAKLYTDIKTQLSEQKKTSNQNDSNIERNLFSNAELILYKLLCKLKIPICIIEFTICNLKKAILFINSNNN